MHFTLPATFAIAAASAVVNAATIPDSSVMAGALVPELVHTSVDELGEVFNATVSLLRPDKDEDEFVGNFANRASTSHIRSSSGEAGAAIGQILGELLKALFPLKDWTPAREH
ncbi:hypothetical protein V5O48_005685 [Marasmius crinis-equi]|uniref:Uncharacterized protein n=1 Tax=Marasmius crinis-equi TaxID=585013 RepID=A0ABR3FM57_9AGAR